MWPQTKPSKEKLKNAKLVAHRGVHENGLAIENSFSAFELAEKNHIWSIEFDVRFTQDHVPVIIHDSDAGRLFDRKDIVIKNTTAHTLRAQIPPLLTLAEVVSLFGKKLHLMIEIKEDLTDRPQDREALKTILSTLLPESDYHLLGLVPDFLECLTFVPKSALMDIIWLKPRLTMKKNQALGHGAIAGHFLFFTTATIERLKMQKKKVGIGFLDSRNSLYRELNRGADFIFTNQPLKLQQCIALDLLPGKG